jgi:hypothetical protein
MLSHLTDAKMLKLSALLDSLDVMLRSNKALIPPRLQTLTRLNSVTCQGISLRCDQPLCTTEDSLALRGHYSVPDLRHPLSRAQGGTAFYPQEPPVLEDLYR